MDEKNIKELEELLKEKKRELEEKLSSMAKKDPQIKGDWDTKFPSFNKPHGARVSEEAADEVEEYENLLPVEHILELKLQDVNQALEKIKKNKYGFCEKCQKPIDFLRLKISPEVKNCLNCKK